MVQRREIQEQTVDLADEKIDRPSGHLNIPIEAEFRRLILERMKQGGFSSFADYVRYAIRSDIDRERERRSSENKDA